LRGRQNAFLKIGNFALPTGAGGGAVKVKTSLIKLAYLSPARNTNVRAAADIQSQDVKSP
jgi:hypothetical protein